MSNLMIMRGIPGSGKSRFAKEWLAEDPENRARVNRDELRKLVHDGAFIKGSKENPGTEKTIIAAQQAMVRRFLESGLDVVDDNTNLPSRSVKALVEIAEAVGAEWDIKDFTDVPVETCVERNRNREDSVPEEVIWDLYKKFVKGKAHPLPFEWTPEPELALEPYIPDITKPKAFLIDIDGTVAINDGVRGHHDYDKVDLDKPNWPIINMVKLVAEAGYTPVFMSGRKDYCRDKTEAWLKEYIFPSGHFELFMRPTFLPDGRNNNTKDYDVKLKLFNKYVRDNFNVRWVFDDRLQVVRMWWKLGVPLFRVGDPEATF